MTALTKRVPTFDSSDLIGANTRTSQKLPDYRAARFGQSASASLRASRITGTDNQNARVLMLREPGGRSFQRFHSCHIQFKTVRRERDRVPEKRRVRDGCRSRCDGTGGFGTVESGILRLTEKRSRRRHSRLLCKEACRQDGRRQGTSCPAMVGNRSPANKSEVPNIMICEYTLTKKCGLASAGRRHS
jgi:hypothetical protein